MTWLIGAKARAVTSSDVDRCSVCARATREWLPLSLSPPYPGTLRACLALSRDIRGLFALVTPPLLLPPSRAIVRLAPVKMALFTCRGERGRSPDRSGRRRRQSPRG